MSKTTIVNGKKRCLVCKEEKEATQNFYLITSSVNGKKYYKSPCKKCLAERRKQYASNYRKENRELIRKKQRSRIKERRENGDEILKRNLKNAKLKHQYGISLEDYEQMLKKQNYCCIICKSHKNDLSKGLFIDHCHTTNKVRGLLCTRCNSMLGMAKDNMEILKSAIKYLQKYV